MSSFTHTHRGHHFVKYYWISVSYTHNTSHMATPSHFESQWRRRFLFLCSFLLSCSRGRVASS
jgi:hypothetical protein